MAAIYPEITYPDRFSFSDQIKAEFIINNTVFEYFRRFPNYNFWAKDWNVKITDSVIPIDSGHTALGEASPDLNDILWYFPESAGILEVSGYATVFSHELAHLFLARYEGAMDRFANNAVHMAANLADKNDLTYMQKVTRIFGSWRIPFITFLVWDIEMLVANKSYILNMTPAGTGVPNQYW